MDIEGNALARKVSCVLDLPDEIIKEICKNCNQDDWISLSLVCKRFRDFAASLLYRHFHIVFPDEEDPYYESPIDSLASGLHTFTTSDYDYAKHLRSISVETLSVGKKAENAYKPFHAADSCGKFMNTLLLLTLRKAQSLDSFKWNIRVELDKLIYKELHSIKPLRHLHIRLQEGPPVYKAPPPLHYQNVQYQARLETLASRAATKTPPTIAAFQNLETLCVLDIDNLELITEIKTCVRNSSSSLRKLKLSFSDNLAMKARGPADHDENGLLVDAGQGSVPDFSQAKMQITQRHRNLQESVLGQIFEVETFQVKRIHRPAESSAKDGQEKGPQVYPSREGKRFIDEVSVVFSRMAANVTGIDDFRVLEQYEAFKTIVKAAKKYVDETDAATETHPSIQAGVDNNEEGEPSFRLDENARSRLWSNQDLLRQIFSPRDEEYGSSMHDTSTEVPVHKLGDELLTIVHQLTWDTNIPKPKGPIGLKHLSAAPPDPTENNTPLLNINETGLKDSVRTVKAMAASTLIDARKTLSLDRQCQEFRDGALRAYRSLELILLSANKIKHQWRVMEAEKAAVHAADAPKGLSASENEQLRRNVNQYVRDTRGIGLESLSLYLVPIRAAVLGKAIDLHCLRQITLLNVGEQKRFWQVMMRENKLKPLALLEVFTDDVSLQFLQFVSELDRVTEVFMLRRSILYTPKSFAPTMEIAIEQIRKFILKKHLPTLERLMIKNEADDSWDIDTPTMRMICYRGQMLTELAVNMAMAAMHTFIQNMGCLVNLRALKVIAFRTTDICMSVMRETRHFIVDTLCNNPELQLEWLAFGDEGLATRIVREQKAQNYKKSASKSKELIPGSHGGSSGGEYPLVPMNWNPTTEEDDDEFDDLLEIELVEGFVMSDVYNIRIFQKEVVAGTL